MPTPMVIDLSHHNTVTNLKATYNDGIRGVIHKATDGTHMIDEKLQARYSLAKEAAMLWGVYHFMRPGNVQAQITHFISTIKAQNVFDDNTLVCLDMERAGITLSDIMEFLEGVESLTRRSPVLYSGNNLKELGGADEMPSLKKYRLWIAQYNNTKPTLPKGYKKYWLWQYSESASVSGVVGTCDVNHFQGSVGDLTTQWSGKGGEVAVNDPEPSEGVESSVNKATTTTIEQSNGDTKAKQVVSETANVELKKETPSTFVKWITAIKIAVGAAITSLTAWCSGNDIATNLGNKAVDQIDKGFFATFGVVLIYALIGIAAGVLLMWIGSVFYDRAARRAAELNKQKVDTAAATDKNTVEFK